MKTVTTLEIIVVLFIIVVILAYAVESKHKFCKPAPFYLFAWSIIGLLTVIWLVYAELFLIGAICLVCTLVHILVIIILYLSYKVFKSYHKPIGKYLGDIFYK